MEFNKLSKEDIIYILKSDKSLLESKFGVIRIGLFGSYSKEAYHADSDIDFLVELKAPRFELLAGLHTYLENTFNKKIELVRKNKHMSNRFLKRIEKDIIYV